MRLAYLTPQYPKVSHTFVRREIRALEAAGHVVLRISIRRPEETLTVDAADREERSKTLFCLAQGPFGLGRAVLATALRTPLRSFRALGLALWLAWRGAGLVRGVAYLVEATFVLQRLRAARIEHLHVHFGTNAASVAWLCRVLGGPPFSFTVHGPDEIDAPVAHALAGKVGAACFVAAVSHYTSAQIRRWIDFGSWSKLHVVHCSVDEPFFEEAAPLEPASQTLVCVGRLCPQKGQLLLLEAFAALRDSHPEARLVLVGDGELRKEVERLVGKYRLESRVTITGWVDEAQVRQHLRSARCMVLPSFAEGLPVVLMEALAMRRPVLSTYIAGIPELVRPGENGWLVPASDVASLREALAEVLDTPTPTLEEMGARGAERVREHHRAATCAAQLMRLFEAEIAAHAAHCGEQIEPCVES